MEKHMLTEPEAANYLGLAPHTLATWRCAKRNNLPFFKIGGAIRYRRADLVTWLETRRIGGPAA